MCLVTLRRISLQDFFAADRNNNKNATIEKQFSDLRVGQKVFDSRNGFNSFVKNIFN